MTSPLVLLIDPRRDFRDAFKAAARDSLRVLAFPDIPGALGALDRHHPTAVVAAMAQGSEHTDGAALCRAARGTLREGLFVAYGLDANGRSLSASAARALRSECALDELLVEDVSAEALVAVVSRDLGIEAERTARSGTSLIRKLRNAYSQRRAEA